MKTLTSILLAATIMLSIVFAAPITANAQNSITADSQIINPKLFQKDTKNILEKKKLISTGADDQEEINITKDDIYIFSVIAKRFITFGSYGFTESTLTDFTSYYYTIAQNLGNNPRVESNVLIEYYNNLVDKLVKIQPSLNSTNDCDRFLNKVDELVSDSYLCYTKAEKDAIIAAKKSAVACTSKGDYSSDTFNKAINNVYTTIFSLEPAYMYLKVYLDYGDSYIHHVDLYCNAYNDKQLISIYGNNYYQNYQQLLSQAKAMIENKSNTIDEVYNMCNKLRDIYFYAEYKFSLNGLKAFYQNKLDFYNYYFNIFSPELQNKIEDALNTALETINKSEITDDDLYDALYDLSTTFYNEILPSMERYDLGEGIDVANGFLARDPDNYTTESYNDLKSAVEKCTAVYNNENLTLDDYQSACSILIVAIYDLEPAHNASGLQYYINYKDKFIENTNYIYGENSDTANEKIASYNDLCTQANALLAQENPSDEEIMVLINKFFQEVYGKIIYGDTNADGNIDITDATLIQKSLANNVSLFRLERMNADADGDGDISIKDVTLIQKYLAGKEQIRTA